MTLDCEIPLTGKPLSIDKRVFRNLIAKGALIPNNDALFEGVTQTYRANQ